MEQNHLYEKDRLRIGKYQPMIWGLVIWGGLFALLQIHFRYHLYYIEQSQLFLFSKAHWCETVAHPGGFARWIGEFLVQFFVLPYAGAAIVALLLVAVSAGVMAVAKRFCVSSCFFLLYLLPAVTLLWMHFDFNYRTQGTVAYLLMLVFLAAYVRIPAFRWRLRIGGVITPVLFWLGGPIVHLFALSALLFEWSKKERGWYTSFFFLFLSILLSLACVYGSISGEFRWILLPDLYYHDALHPKPAIYGSWGILPVILLVSHFLQQKSVSDKRTVRWLAGIVQVCLFVGFIGWSVIRFGDSKSLKLKRLDYYARTGQWDRTIEACQGELTNFLYLCHLNMALAHKGMLADRMFAYDQRGINGLLVQANKSENVSCLLSDAYFAMGATALSQEMAFEGYVCAMDNGNPRMLKRLVQTNLIYGAYPVAEKYISLLEKTFAYRGWAKSQRKFLYNDEAVEKDPVLGVRRKALPIHNTLAQLDGLTVDLERFSMANPTFQAPIQYAGAIYLLSKDLERFKGLIERFYGTDALPVLPLHFQEAVVILAENNPEYWSRFQLSETLITRFTAYKQLVLANRNNNALAGLAYRSYGNSYWFYYMFK